MVDNFDKTEFGSESELLWNHLLPGLKRYCRKSKYSDKEYVTLNVSTFLICKVFSYYGNHPEILAKMKNELLAYMGKSIDIYVEQALDQNKGRKQIAHAHNK